MHAGYYSGLFGPGYSHLLAIEKEINSVIIDNPKIKQIYLTGHSMGGAIASIVGMELLARGQIIRTRWFDASKSIYLKSNIHHNSGVNDTTHQSIDSSNSGNQLAQNSLERRNSYQINLSVLFSEIAKQKAHHQKNNSNTSSNLSEELLPPQASLDEVNHEKRMNILQHKKKDEIRVDIITFGSPCFISSLQKSNKLVSKIEPSHPVYTSGYFHRHTINVTHQYDPAVSMSFGQYGLLKRQIISWFTKV